MSEDLLIAPLCESHWPAVREIYLEGIASGNATFENSAPSWLEWDEGHWNFARIVAIDTHGVAGWAALAPVSRRPVYAGVAEISVYVAERARGTGVGRALMAELVARSEKAGLWTLQAVVFPENVASIRLHEGAGFREVGVRSKLGCMHGRWRDVLLLERRSVVTGVEGATLD